jgi:hypothetical protein
MEAGKEGKSGALPRLFLVLPPNLGGIGQARR